MSERCPEQWKVWVARRAVKPQKPWIFLLKQSRFGDHPETSSFSTFVCLLITSYKFLLADSDSKCFSLCQAHIPHIHGSVKVQDEHAAILDRDNQRIFN